MQRPNFHFSLSFSPPNTLSHYFLLKFEDLSSKDWLEAPLRGFCTWESLLLAHQGKGFKDSLCFVQCVSTSTSWRPRWRSGRFSIYTPRSANDHADRLAKVDVDREEDLLMVYSRVSAWAMNVLVVCDETDGKAIFCKGILSPLIFTPRCGIVSIHCNFFLN